MTTPKKMTPERLGAMLRLIGGKFPNGAIRIAQHIAALEQEAAPARAEGFAAAREMAELEGKAALLAWFMGNGPDGDAPGYVAERIRALQDERK